MTEDEFRTLIREQPVLEGRHVRLEPLSRAHEQELYEASRPVEIWTYLRTHSAQPTSLDDFRRDFTEEALAAAEAGSEVPFAVVDRQSGKAIGSTRYLDISPQFRHVEIGWTWYAPVFWRTAVNTECKYLLLTHAFERLGCIRVQLRTDALNARSRAAIERIGGRLEGIIRQDRIVKGEGGRVRSSAQYSLIDSEWPQSKARLEAMLNRDRVRQDIDEP